jgi:hypothetical protein
MTNMKTIGVLALSLLVASTTLASAEIKILKPREIVPATLYIPIIVVPSQPKDEPLVPIIPGKFGFDDPKPRPRLAPESKSLVIDCQVKDVVPTTDDLWLLNDGNAELPAGLKIKFHVPATGDHGAFMLNRSIAAGHKIKIAGLLDDAPSGAPCRVQILA